MAKRKKKPIPVKTSDDIERETAAREMARDLHKRSVFRQHGVEDIRSRPPSQDAPWLDYVPPAKPSPEHLPPEFGVDAARVETVRLPRQSGIKFVRAPNKALLYYRNRKNPLITEAQYSAAFCLYLDFEESQLSPQAVSDPSRIIVDGGGWRDFTPARLDAVHRVRDALAAVKGIGARMIVHVCCHGELLRAKDFPPYKDAEQKMARFREALDDLYAHFMKNPDGIYSPFT